MATRAADDLLAGLPGETLFRQGLADAQAGRCTIPACLVQIARRRLHQAGLLPPEVTVVAAEPELQLYHLLRREPGDAYARYNSLLRELVSLESVLDRRHATAPSTAA